VFGFGEVMIVCLGGFVKNRRRGKTTKVTC